MTFAPSMVDTRPALPAEQVAALVEQHFGLVGTLASLPAEWDQNFRLDAPDGRRYVVKLANAAHAADVLDLQNATLLHLRQSELPLETPDLHTTGTGTAMCPVEDAAGRTCHLRVLSWLDGTPLSAVDERPRALLEAIGTGLGAIDVALASFDHPAADRTLRWDLAAAQWTTAHTGVIASRSRRAIVERLLLQYRGRVLPHLANLPVSVIHNDANDENLLVDPSDLRVTGLLDFGDMLRSHTVNELAIAAAYATFDAADPLAALAHMARGYHRARPLQADEARVLFPLMCIRLCVSVTMSALAARHDPANAHATISDGSAWTALESLVDVDWDDAAESLLDICAPVRRVANASEPDAAVRATRDAHVGPSLSLAGEPLQITRGRGAYLFAPNGRAYLDCVNNVCHVGHCHPDVVAAIAEQAAVLNTNTRYLHPLIGAYAERLTRTLPAPLSVCYFVNSGSEANELAVRLARTWTKRRGARRPRRCLPRPQLDARGPEPIQVRRRRRRRARGVGRGRTRAGRLPGGAPRHGRRTALRRGRRRRLRGADRARIAAGVLHLRVDPRLRWAGRAPRRVSRSRVRARARAAGAACIVDEVQVGFGRAGAHMWAFEAQGVVPDIVTMGKPIGNGHPLGAVVTTREIADTFDNGMEYFNTFGGNPVSCAAGARRPRCDRT